MFPDSTSPHLHALQPHPDQILSYHYHNHPNNLFRWVQDTILHLGRPASDFFSPCRSENVTSSEESDCGSVPVSTSLGHPIISNAVNIPSSLPVHQRRGSLQLWQFLVALLDEPNVSGGCIMWTGRGMEFKLVEPEEVARRWGIQKNRPAMNYDKLSRSLRYYYEKGIMQKVAGRNGIDYWIIYNHNLINLFFVTPSGERYVYKFVCEPDALFSMAYGHGTAAASSSSPQHSSDLSSPASPRTHLHNHDTPPSCSMIGGGKGGYSYSSSSTNNYVHQN